MPVTLWAVLWVGEITSAAAWNPEHVMQVWRNTAIESLLFMSIRWQSIRINASLLWTRSLGMTEARTAFGLPPMSPSLWASQSLTLILLTRFCQGSQVMCIQVSRSSLVCHSGGKTLALVVEVLREAQISIFTLRDRADPARYHSRCDKCLCKLDDSHTFCKGLMTPDSLVSPTLLRQGRVLEGTGAVNVTFSCRILCELGDRNVRAVYRPCPLPGWVLSGKAFRAQQRGKQAVHFTLDQLGPAITIIIS